MKKILSGNEAIALGAYKAGVKVGTGYPGTPSTEILENLKSFPGVYTEWSVNEKVALEVGIGSSLAGTRTLVTMKHVGLNVAADPLFTSSYIGVKGGLVIINADDPGMHSSQNEQDNRNYAKASKIPMLEPSDSQEAMDFTILAFELSEKFDTPVIIRTTTRISHSKSVVFDDQKMQTVKPSGFEKNPGKYVMIPAFARARHLEVEKRMNNLENDADTLDINKIEINNTDLGIITSGICYNYVKEALPDVSILKLGMVHPLPKKMISDFSNKVKKIVIVEELDPFFETQIKSMGMDVEGKNIFSIFGEFSPDIIINALGKSIKPEKIKIDIKIPPRPPSLCPGCPHRNVFALLHKKGYNVSGDIGCYTLGVMPPFSAIDSCVDMGASINIAQGIEIVEGNNNKTVAVIGDSTFAHSGITGLINAAYNKRNIMMIVLDNGTTAMTGMQGNPFSGERITGEPSVIINYEKLAESVGIKSPDFRIVDAYEPDEIEKAVTEMTETHKLSLLVVKGLCVLYNKKKKQKG
jgi:indolepyruvate ferredoxin oxidoreductase, alpha subunit